MPRFLSRPLPDRVLGSRSFGAAVVTAITLLALVCFGQTPSLEAPLSPRDLFLSAEPGEKATGRSLSVLYGLLRLQPDGTFAGVDPRSAVFHSGDRVRLRIEANQEAYIAVLQRGSSGMWSVLYPRASGSLEPLRAFQVCGIPDSTGSFAFDEQAGEERLVLIVSRAPIFARAIVGRLNLEEVQESKPPRAAWAGQGLLARDLVYELVEDDKRSGFAGAAVYVADGAKDDAPLLVNIPLRHLK